MLEEKKSKLELGEFFANTNSLSEDGFPTFRILANGKWIPSEASNFFDLLSPVDGLKIANIVESSIADANNVVKSAFENKQKIRDIPGIERVEIFNKASNLLLDHKEDFSRTLMLEAGKTRRDAEGEVKATAERMSLTMEEARKIFGEYIPGDWSADTTEKFALVIREPIGVVLAISPFNYPLFIGSAKIIPALLAGNSVISKPASATPISLILFGRILEEAGIPQGAFNLITGGGHHIGEALVSDERVSLVSFTGSTEVGKSVQKVAGLKKLHLELGGKGMAIVLEDTDPVFAASKCAEGALKSAGQRCDAISAVLVVEKIADQFVEEVLQKVNSSWKVGNPSIDRNVNIGPLIDETAANRVQGLVDDAIANGAKLLRGGKHDGAYFEPTVLDQVPQDSRIALEETFGPVVTIIRIQDEEEAIELGKKSRYGLDSCVFTSDFYRMWKIAKKLVVGEITINDLPRHGVGFFPFGGSKQSGMGREGIGYSIDEMTELKTIVFNLEPAKLGKTMRPHAH